MTLKAKFKTYIYNIHYYFSSLIIKNLMVSSHNQPVNIQQGARDFSGKHFISTTFIIIIITILFFIQSQLTSSFRNDVCSTCISRSICRLRFESPLDTWIGPAPRPLVFTVVMTWTSAPFEVEGTDPCLVRAGLGWVFCAFVFFALPES